MEFRVAADAADVLTELGEDADAGLTSLLVRAS
jgi:hypothetical protein